MATDRKFSVCFIGPPDGLNAVSKVVGEVGHVTPSENNSIALTEVLRTSDALIDASMRIRITDQIIEHAPQLKIISTATTGSDHIDKLALERKGITLVTLKEDNQVIQNLTPAAELSWCLLLSLARHLCDAVNHVRNGYWLREEFPGIMLNGKTLGLVGCGRIGQWMARYAEAFGMNTFGYDPHLEFWPKNITKTTLANLAETSDFISVHAHLSEETCGLLDTTFFQTVKPGSIFINTSRGPVADEDALLEALESGRLAGAGLDVLNGEPDIAGHPLVKYSRINSNLLITPHCGGFSLDAIRVVCSHAARKVVDYFKENSFE